MTIAPVDTRKIGSSEDPIMVGLLRELITEVQALRADLARDRQTPSALSRGDRAHLERLLPAIGGALGSEPFASAEILEHQAAAVRLVCAGLSAKQLGRLLRRAIDTPVGGYMVERLGSEAGAVLWRIVQFLSFQGTKRFLFLTPSHATGLMESRRFPR